MINLNEPPLHCAVLTDDYESVKDLSKITASVNATNSLGFTALEIAQYLGKGACEKILCPDNAKLIPVMKPGANHSERLTPLQFEHFFHVKYCAHLHFSNYPFLQQVLQGCPWSVRKFLKRENKLQIHYQTKLSKGVVAETAIRWIDQDLGYGLFALQDIPVNSFIGEYTGLVRRLPPQKPDKNNYCLLYPNLFKTVIDALAHGNETRFINHSDTPNLQLLCVSKCNLLHFILIAKAPIQAGTQLTFDYGKHFWMHRQKIQI